MGYAGMNKMLWQEIQKTKAKSKKGGHNMKKRLFSALLCFCMLAGLLPAAAFAVETDTGKAIQLGTSAIKKGDSVYYGTATAR